jgi:hypothetical protein
VIAFSPDGKTLAMSGYLSQFDLGLAINLCDAGTGKPYQAFDVYAKTLVFSSDGKLLIGLGKLTLRVWELTTRQKVYQFKRPHDLDAVVVTPSGRILTLENKGGPQGVDWWEVLAGKILRNFRVRGNEFQGLALSPGGTTLATAMSDTTVLLWDLRDLRSTARNRPAHLSAKKLNQLWEDLAGNKAAAAFQAVQTLASVPEKAVPLLKGHVRPIARPNSKRLAQFIRKLDSSRFPVRKKAADEIVKVGEAAEPALREVLAGKPTLEVRQRIQALLKKLERPTSPEALRAIRAVQVLEYIGTAEAKRLLRRLAEGAPGAWLTEDARAAIKRLADRSRPR